MSERIIKKSEVERAEAAEAYAGGIEAELKKLKSDNSYFRNVAKAACYLQQPDGVIRGPLCNGPELDDLNEAIAAAREGGVEI